jgi:flagellar biosynthesis/type III secretory pathway chaperone
VRRLTGLHVFNASEASFGTLTDAQGIEELEFEATDLRTPAFGEIGKLTSLKTLTAINCQLLPEQLAVIQNLTNLENLELMFTVIQGPAESREKLLGELSSAEKQTRDTLQRSGVYENVIQAALLTDRAMPYLSKLTKLKKLDLINTYISAEGLKHLKDLANLEVAHFGPMGLTAETVTPLQGMTKLRSLEYFNADDGIVDALSKITSLEHLNIWSGDVTDIGASRLVNLKKLQRLEIRGNKMTDHGLQQLRPLPDLKYLDLSYAGKLTTNGIAQFLKLRPDVEIKYVRN